MAHHPTAAWTRQDGTGHRLTGRVLARRIGDKPGPEFAAQAYAACLAGTGDSRQQASVGAQLARSRADLAQLQRRIADLMRQCREDGHQVTYRDLVEVAGGAL